MTPDQARQVKNWQGNMTYCWTKEQIAAWFDARGGFTMWYGQAVTLKIKKLDAGRYFVSTMTRKAED